MALWMTVKQEFFGLAALLLVFSCACAYVFLRGRGRGKRRQPAFLSYRKDFFYVITNMWREWRGGGVRGNGKKKWKQEVQNWKIIWRRTLAGSVTVGSVVIVCTGAVTGIWRMEAEQRVIRRETALVESAAGCLVDVEGRVEDIGETDYGYRLILNQCKLEVKSGENDEMQMTGERRSEQLAPLETAEEVRRQDQDSAIRRMYVYVKDVESLKIGQKLRVRGEVKLPEPDRNPGQFDFRSYCFAKGICGNLSCETVELVDSQYLWGKETLRQAGLLLEERLEQIAAAEDLGILKAVLLGEKQDMDDDLYKLYQKNGISHVLAISGLHVSVIGMGLWNGLRKLGAGYWSAGAAAFGMLFCFGSIAGFGPSVVRAVFMMGISFVAGIFGRTYDLPSAMCVPGMGILLWNPYMLTQASFQLSFLAVFAIFFPGAYLTKVWKLQGFLQNVWTSVSIQVVTLPVVLYHSFEVPVFGLVLNMFVVPLMTYVLVSGILGLAGSFLWIRLGMFLLGGAHYILALYWMVCKCVEKISGAYLVPGRPSFWAIVVYYCCLVSGAWFASGNWSGVKRRMKFGTRSSMEECQKKMIGLAIWYVGILALLPLGDNGLIVTFLDVGQGDGILVEADGRTLLVDCGSSQEKTLGEDCLVPFLKSRGVSRLDVVAVTHGDQDHVSGIRELLEDPDCEIAIGQLVMPVSSVRDEACERLVELADFRGIQVSYMDAETVSERVSKTQDRNSENRNGRSNNEGNHKKADEIVVIGSENTFWNRIFGEDVPGGRVFGDALLWDWMFGAELQVDCLYPLNHFGADSSDRNNGSLVLRLEYGHFSMILTGDVEQEGEMQMLHAGEVEPVTVLKAAHHGSASSTTEAFLEVLSPEYVVFSYGEGNRYGHPAAEVVDRCEEAGAEIWKTAESGAVAVWTDGKIMQISGWLDRRNGI